MLLGNGYLEPGLAEIRRRFPDHKLRKGVVNRGARFTEDDALEISPKGEVIWGEFSQSASPWEKALLSRLESEGFAWDSHVCKARQDKWFCNTVLNTLCGVYRLKRNGDASMLNDYGELCHEVYELGSAFWPEWRGQEARLKAKLDALIVATGDNENSMARDMRLGRATEAEFLSGHVKAFPDASRRFPLLSAFHSQLTSRSIVR